MTRIPKIVILVTLLSLLAMPLSAFAQSEEAADLSAIKTYSLDQAAQMQEHTAVLAQIADRYYTLLEEAEFDYEAAWEANQAELAGLIAAAQQEWIAASNLYELNEGIVAGVPSLSYFDVWIDAGPSGEEGGEDALDWQLELPDGTVLDKPGNFMTHLTEPALFGTNEDFVGLEVDLNGDGELTTGELLPEANILTASLNGLNDATTEMLETIEAWEPTLEDAYVALVTMLPTMSEYFGQWKESVWVTGEESEQQSFVAVSRLIDISGILYGLSVTYDSIRPEVATQDAELDTQIRTGFDELLSYVESISTQEQDGIRFTPEEADLFGTEAQTNAEALAALVAQAADNSGIDLT
jgi:hypothetical protein